MNKIIDFRKPDLRKVSKGTTVITTKGFKFKLVSRIKGKESWKDMKSGVIWHDVKDDKYTHYRAQEKFGDLLPTKEDFEEAELHGFREVLPNMGGKCFWSSSVYPYFSDFAYYFVGFSGFVFDDLRSDHGSVRCVGR